MSTSFIPRKDSDFLKWIVAFLLNLFPWLTRFGIPDDRYQSLAALRNDFSAKLETAENPATRTKKAL
jgi:hypothetical protein